MNYRSFADLEASIAANLWKIPADTELIVGIPRSGLLPATMLALHLNRPLADLDGWLEGRVLSSGYRLQEEPIAVDEFSKIVVVDDSVRTGREMRRTRKRIEEAGLSAMVTYVAIYVNEERCREVDIYFEVCPAPRVFAWNLMHRPMLAEACVDIDGVLCVDPTEDQNDDGPNYLNFLETAQPLLLPTWEIGSLVTCRLEKYRPQTEKWLLAHGVKYRELIMWKLESKAERVASGGHAAFKASVYRARPNARFFIESSARQGQEIANLTCRPVICVETQKVCLPGLRQWTKGAVVYAPWWIPKALRSAKERLLENGLSSAVRRRIKRMVRAVG
jgi:uncharacterized HAD superfamily protein/hypoxanthine phosphoribosyltransferase